MDEHLSISRQAFVANLKTLSRTATRCKDDEIVFSFDGACLHVELGGACMLIPAQGRLDGQFRMRADVVFLWIKAPPPGDPIVFTFEGSLLKFGTSATAIIRQPVWSKSLEVPVNGLSFLHLLALPGKYSEEELKHTGLWDSVSAAEEELWSAFEKSSAAYHDLGLKTRPLFDCLIAGIQKLHGPKVDLD